MGADEKFVWVTDHAGRSYPRLKTYVEANREEFTKVNERHPVRGRSGKLLSVKFRKENRIPAGPSADLEVFTVSENKAGSAEEEK